MNERFSESLKTNGALGFTYSFRVSCNQRDLRGSTRPWCSSSSRSRRKAVVSLSPNRWRITLSDKFRSICITSSVFRIKRACTKINNTQGMWVYFNYWDWNLNRNFSIKLVWDRPRGWRRKKDTLNAKRTLEDTVEQKFQNALGSTEDFVIQLQHVVREARD